MPTPGNAPRDIVLTEPTGLVNTETVPVQLPFGSGTFYEADGTTPAVPLFDGQGVFGSIPAFSVGLLHGKPADFDGWLGLTPGTTVYGAGPGRVWGVAGTFAESTSAACTADLAALEAVAGPSADFWFPSGEKFPYTAWQKRPSCRIVPGEVVGDPNGVQGSGSYWTLKFWCVVREPGF